MGSGLIPPHLCWCFAGAVGASQGFLGLIAYLGAANAGVPLSMILNTYGWNGYFTALMSACCCSFLLLIPLMNAKSFAQTKSNLAMPNQ